MHGSVCFVLSSFHLFLGSSQTHRSFAADVLSTVDAVNHTTYYRFPSSSAFSPAPRRPWRLYLEAGHRVVHGGWRKIDASETGLKPYPLFTKCSAKTLPRGERIVTTVVVKGGSPFSLRVYTSVNNVDISSDPTLLCIIHDIRSCLAVLSAEFQNIQPFKWSLFNW